MNKEEILKLTKEEILEKLKETYQKQKLTKNQSYIARGIEIIFGLWFIFLDIGLIYKLIYILAVGYSMYRMLKPNAEDEEYYKKLEQLANGIEKLKKYKNRELDKEIEENKIEKLEKSINKLLPKLLKENKLYKRLAFIPIVNLRVDEMTSYRDPADALNVLLYGKLRTPGLNIFDE